MTYMRKYLYFTIEVVLIIILIQFNLRAQINEYRNGVVSSADELASEVGIKIMQNGGNAVDAAVGVGFALAVVYPQAGNIGGGGFMVIRLADGREVTIDYRETAPMLSTRDMYLDAGGNPVEGLSTVGHLACGVPGSVAGLLYALDKYGTMSRSDVMKYAIEIAENGFGIHKRLAAGLNDAQADFKKFESTMKVFGGKWRSGDKLVQKDLAAVLQSVSDFGRDGFYKGWVADMIVREMKRGNGIISYGDLESYKPIERKPVNGKYKGYDVVTMGPPSSGGICLLYLLNIVENFNGSFERGTALYFQLLAESMRRVYADRSEFMGDMDFVKVPFEQLISKQYALGRYKEIVPGTATPSSDVKPGDPWGREHKETTHYSVADGSGNIVSVTTTLNDTFGNSLVVDGAGFLLNNEMDDFSIKPGVPNIYGLVGNEVNAIQPGKRMLSSMTPAILMKNGKPFLVIGSPGGGRIITAVLQTILNVIDYGMPLDKAVKTGRIHHQWLPDVVYFERGAIETAVQKELKAMGYELRQNESFGRIDAIIFNNNETMSGFSDMRGYGKALGY